MPGGLVPSLCCNRLSEENTCLSEGVLHIVALGQGLVVGEDQGVYISGHSGEHALDAVLRRRPRGTPARPCRCAGSSLSRPSPPALCPLQLSATPSLDQSRLMQGCHDAS